MIRGIRAHKKTEANYIGQCLGEIKMELKQEDHDTKATAVQKLIYLQLLNYDIRLDYTNYVSIIINFVNISWSAFNIIEVMSQPKFTHKRIAYLAAAQSFNDYTEVSMLSTALFKKVCCINTHRKSINPMIINVR